MTAARKPRLKLAMLAMALVVCITSAAAQPPTGTWYITQLHDTLSRLAEKYLDSADNAPAIIQATEARRGQFVPQPLVPGVTLFIPAAPIPTPVPPPTATPAPLSGKIAFSFFNRALSRRVWEIDVLNLSTGRRHIVRWNQISEPALSPDGTHLAFRGWADTGHVLSVGPLDESRHWPIAGFQEDSRPDWSHDGSRLVFGSQRENDRLWRIFTVQADGQNERILARPDGMPFFGEDPAWSFKDDRIIYRGCAADGNQCGLWFAALDGIVSAPIVVDGQAIQPDGSPTANEVVFASAQSGNWEIYRVAMDGSDLRQLTDHPAVDGMPVWSPDGEWIAFQSARPGDAPAAFETGPSQGGQSVEGNWGIWVMRRNGSGLRQVFAFDGGLMKANRLDLPYGSRDWVDEQISWGR